MPGSLLPPPPPPAHIRTWPDRAALLADRGRALEELRRRSLGVHRVLLLWLLALAAIVGWALLVLPLRQLEQRDPTGFVLGPLFALLGLAALAPTVVAVALSVRRDHHIHRLLDAWSALDRHPATDSRLRSPASASSGCSPRSASARSAPGRPSRRPRGPSPAMPCTAMSSRAWVSA